MRLLLSTLFILSLSFCAYAQVDYLKEGNTYLNNKEFKKAEKTFKAGIKAEPDNLIYQCQLGLTLIEQKEFKPAEKTLKKVLKIDSTNVGAIWYSGIGNFKAGQERNAIERFEKALTLLDENSGQYFAANWYIGKCYSVLLKTEGLSYNETDRMFECFEEYLRLQPNANDAEKIREYVERKKKRRPPDNVKNWVDM
jgi:tetratricopeptide (TPR) repeat protein